MMNVALFGKSVDANDIPYIQGMVSLLESFGGRIHVYDLFFRQVKEQLQFSSPPLLFHGQEEIRGKADYLFSIGGDGTMLDSIPLVGDSGIPVAGINLGRMGFLSGISKEEIPSALEEIRNRQFILDQRPCSGWRHRTGSSGITTMPLTTLPSARTASPPCFRSGPGSTTSS